MLSGLFDDAGCGEKAITALIDLFAGHGENGVGIGDPPRIVVVDRGDFREMMSQPHGNGRRLWRLRPD